MKCVKELFTDLITRVNDERAQLLVKKNTHVYVSKKFWKQSRITVNEPLVAKVLGLSPVEKPVEKPKRPRKPSTKVKDKGGKK